MLFTILLLIVLVLPIHSLYQSKIKFTAPGLEYQPYNNNNLQLISTNIAQSKIRCSAACNQLSPCRIFDYDTVSKRCRLFEGDSTTGSIISSSSSTSLVGTIGVSSTLYLSIHNQSCQACQQNRYETCSSNTSTCQCPRHTYWNGSMCALQLFENDTCPGQLNSCRLDLNISCLTDCYGNTPKCVSSTIYNTTFSFTMRFGTTVAGACNGSTSTNQTILISQADVILGSNNILYTGDNSNRLLVFALNNRTARPLRSFLSWPAFLAFDNRTSNIYVSILIENLVYIWPTNKTIPPNGISYGNCSMNWVWSPTGVAVDSVGNVYIASLSCNWVTKWAPNATSGTLVAGLSTAAPGSVNQSLYAPYGLALDEANSFLYVADRYNYRVQRFVLGGSGIGVTVAGGHGSGIAANQLNLPTDVFASRLDGSVYVADCYNNRVQKWQKNATYGTTIAGNPNGILGNSPYLLYRPYGMDIDNGENYLYVSDSQNNRIQRFPLR